MLAIPVPFVVSLMLLLAAITLYTRLTEQAKVPCFFLVLCALTTALVGLRWTFDLAIFRIVQPIMASLIPVCAWYCYLKGSGQKLTQFYIHLCGPAVVIIALFTQYWWHAPLDALITIIYVGYGAALIVTSHNEQRLDNVSLGQWDGVKKATRVAGAMLLFSAFIDCSMSLDFWFRQGKDAMYILATGHLIMLPLLCVAVIMISVATPVQDELTKLPHSSAPKLPKEDAALSEQRAKEIVFAFETLMREKSVYLDPDLTLNKLSRKLLIPAKQLSTAINLICQRNISKLINEYRIDHAKQELVDSDETITQIFMRSGFQTKSNFNREFSRITGVTPSAYRKQQGK